MKSNMKIVFFGAGAVGQSVGGWIAPHHDNVFFLDQGEVATYHERERGYSLQKRGREQKRTCKT